MNLQKIFDTTSSLPVATTSKRFTTNLGKPTERSFCGYFFYFFHSYSAAGYSPHLSEDRKSGFALGERRLFVHSNL
jgi:hypothetical protein